MRSSSAHSNPQDPAKQRRQTATFSLVGSVGVAAVIITVWFLSRPHQPAIAAQRSLSEITVEWRCPNSHSFQRSGSAVPVPCTQCDRKANILVSYECPRDGDIEALMRYERIRGSSAKVSQASFRSGVWVDVNGVINCPVCGVGLRPASRHPFRGARRPDADGG